jgi:chromosome segregation ATPase
MDITLMLYLAIALVVAAALLGAMAYRNGVGKVRTLESRALLKAATEALDQVRALHEREARELAERSAELATDRERLARTAASIAGLADAALQAHEGVAGGTA